MKNEISKWKKSIKLITANMDGKEESRKIQREGVIVFDRYKVKIQMPETMDLDVNYEQTIGRVLTIRNALSRGYRIKRIVFDDIRYISPSAALILASEIDRWNIVSKWKLRAEVDRWNDDIKKLLCQMGYFELLGLNRPAACPFDDNVAFMPFIRGEIGIDDGGLLAKSLRVCIEDVTGESIDKESLFAGLSEAIVNVSHHAYETLDPIRKKLWWATASYKRSTRQLNVVFYDQGDGIPFTLPKVKWFEHIKDAFNLWNDAEKIQAAMKKGRSSVVQPERGKGLMNLTEFAKFSKNGKLTITSLCGSFEMRYSKGDESDTALRMYPLSVGGTLIEWVIYV